MSGGTRGELMVDEERDDRAWIVPRRDHIPTLLVCEGEDLNPRYYTACDDALLAAQAADRLGLGWRLDAYDAPVNDDDFQREWRLLIWKEQRSDALIGLRDASRSEPAAGERS